MGEATDQDGGGAVAFIGLGNMGGPMAARLAGAGRRVIGVDLDAKACDALKAVGGEIAAGPKEAMAAAPVTVVALPAARHVRGALVDSGALAAAPDDALVIDCSTIDPESARGFAAEAEAIGKTYLDSPMSGGVPGAREGRLTFMVGGPEAALERARPTLSAMGVNIYHAGGPGAGAAAKLCNNMLLAISMIGVSEAFGLAKKLGLEPQKLYDIASTATGRCWSLNDYCPEPGPVPGAPSNRGWRPGFAADLMLKDLRLAMAAAQAGGAATPLGAHATQIYGLMSGAGGGGLDFSGVIAWLEGELPEAIEAAQD